MTRRLIQWATRLYPAAWRERYGAEFTATVEDMPAPSLSAVWDVCKGALVMRLAQGVQIRRTAALCGILGLAIAWGVSLQIKDRFLSEATVQAVQLDPKTLAQSLDALLNRQFLMSLVEKHKLYTAERCCVPMEDLLEDMKKNFAVAIRNQNGQSPQILTVSFKYPDAAVAQKVTSDLTTALLAERAAGQLTLLHGASDGVAFYPNRRSLAFAGLLGGTIVGLGWGLLSGRKAKLAS